MHSADLGVEGRKGVCIYNHITKFHIKIFFVYMSARAVPVSWISINSCRDSGNRAKQSGAEHHIFPYEQPNPVRRMKSFQLRMCEMTC